jgi:hypothetical protein
MKTRDFPGSQKIGSAWTIIFAVLTTLDPTAFRNSDLETVLILFVLPIACLLAVFAWFRTGGYIAFCALTLATLALLVSPLGLVAMLGLLFGGPLALAWSLWLARRAKRDAQTLGAA